MSESGISHRCDDEARPSRSNSPANTSSETNYGWSTVVRRPRRDISAEYPSVVDGTLRSSRRHRRRGQVLADVEDIDQVVADTATKGGNGRSLQSKRDGFTGPSLARHKWLTPSKTVA